MATNVHDDNNVRNYLKIFFRHKAVIITTIVILTMTVFVTLSMFTMVYEAKVLMIKQAEKATAADYYSDLRAGSARLIEVEIAKSNPIIERTVNALKLYNRPLDYEKQFSSRLKTLLIEYRHEKSRRELEKLPEEKKRVMLFNMAVRQLRGSLKVEQQKDTNIFSMTIVDYSPNAAVTIANVISRAYLIYNLERQLAEIRLKYGEEHSITKQVKDKISEMKKNLDGRLISDIEAIGPASVKIIEQAKEASRVKLYNKNLLLVVTFLLSVVLGMIFAVLLDFMDQTIKTPRDIEAFLNMPFLGSIPEHNTKDKLLIDNPHPTPGLAKSYQNLSDNLDLLIKDKNLKTILISDVESSEDTAAVIANISIYLARKEMDSKVLVIDANLRSPIVSEVFNITGAPGLADILEGKIDFEDAVKEWQSSLFFLTAGSTVFNPSTLLDSSKMSDLIGMVKEKYDMVFLACANLNNFTDAAVLSSIVDAFILVVNEGKVRCQVAKHAITPLEQKKAKLVGGILNNRNFSIPKIIYDRL